MKTLPDYLRKGMKLVIVGCNPTESSVRAGHYYAGRGNPFWPTLYESGVVPEPFDYPDDRRIIEFGIGLTDLVKRPTKSDRRTEARGFCRRAHRSVAETRRVFVRAWWRSTARFTYEQFAQRKCNYGLQKGSLYGAQVFVLPSTVGQTPRAQD